MHPNGNYYCKKEMKCTVIFASWNHKEASANACISSDGKPHAVLPQLWPASALIPLPSSTLPPALGTLSSPLPITLSFPAKICSKQSCDKLPGGLQVWCLCHPQRSALAITPHPRAYSQSQSILLWVLQLQRRNLGLWVRKRGRTRSCTGMVQRH